MSRKAPLVGGVLHDSGTFYLLVSLDDADEDESVVATGRAERKRIVLTERTGLEEFVSIIPLSLNWVALGEAACLTAEGSIYFLKPNGTQAETIQGAGYSRPDSRGVGRMASLREADGWLFAMGFGGQVYRRRADSAWEDISITPSSGTSLGAPLFYTVAPGPAPGSLVFGGLNVSEYKDTEEIEAADEEGDDDRLADLILDSVEDDTVSICVYDRRWTKSEFDTSGYVAPIFRESASSWLIFVSTGTIWRTREFQSFDEIFATQDPQEQWGDVKLWHGQPLVLNDGALQILQGNQLIEFPDPLPPLRASPCLSVSPSTSRLAAIHRSAVQLYDGNSWARLTPVLA